VKPVRSASMLRAAVILILVTLAGVVVAAPAQAAAYRYWGYWHLEKGDWAFARTGPAGVVPADGSVDGWRFAVTDESSQRKPRVLPSFDTLCAGTAAKSGSKRVGLVIDYGRSADSAGRTQPPVPRAICVAVPEKATGADVLAAGTTLRLDKGQTCGIDGWPATGCSELVDPVPATAASPDTSIAFAAPKSSTASLPARSEDQGETSLLRPVLGAGAVVLIAALGFAAWRRSRDATAS
jgi:hypothetical protein